MPTIPQRSGFYLVDCITADGTEKAGQECVVEVISDDVLCLPVLDGLTVGRAWSMRFPARSGVRLLRAVPARLVPDC